LIIVKKKIIVVICIAAVLSTAVAAQAFGLPAMQRGEGGVFPGFGFLPVISGDVALPPGDAAQPDDAPLPDNAAPPDNVELPDGAAPEDAAPDKFSDDVKARIEAAMAEREAERAEYEAELEAFIDSLSEEQKAAFDKLFGNIPARRFDMGGGEGDEGGENAAGDPFGGESGNFNFGGRFPDMPKMPDRAEMEAKAAQFQEKLEAFKDLLTDEQKAELDALTQLKPQDGKFGMRIDEEELAAIKERWEAFVNSLTDEQKDAYDEIFGSGGGVFAFRSREPEDGGDGEEGGADNTESRRSSDADTAWRRLPGGDMSGEFGYRLPGGDNNVRLPGNANDARLPGNANDARMPDDTNSVRLPGGANNADTPSGNLQSI
jgi:hypothetical protein